MKPGMERISVVAKESPPVRGRGLKPALCSPVARDTRSPPVRGRGLKHQSHTA